MYTVNWNKEIVCKSNSGQGWILQSALGICPGRGHCRRLLWLCWRCSPSTPWRCCPGALGWWQRWGHHRSPLSWQSRVAPTPWLLSGRSSRQGRQGHRWGWMSDGRWRPHPCCTGTARTAGQGRTPPWCLHSWTRTRCRRQRRLEKATKRENNQLCKPLKAENLLTFFRIDPSPQRSLLSIKLPCLNLCCKNGSQLQGYLLN